MDKQVLKWQIKIGKDKYDVDLNKELDINLSDLTEEMRTQPGKYAWFAALHEKVKLLESQAKNDLQVIYAQLDEQYRDEAASRGVKTTENSIKYQIIGNPRYLKAEKKYENLSYRAGILKAAREAFAQKKDMLIQLSANTREEFKNEGE